MIPVLLMSRELGPGGSERQLAETAQHIRQFGFDAHVGCFRGGGIREAEIKSAGVPVVDFSIRSFRKLEVLRGARWLLQYVRNNRIQLVHSFDYPTAVFTLPLIRSLTDVTAISSQRAHRSLLPFPYSTAVRATDHFVDGIVVNCRFVEEHLVADYRIPRDRIHLCYNGIDLSKFEPHGLSAKSTAIPQGALTIGVVCVQRPEKGLSTLLEAFAKLPYQTHNLQLLLVGSGPMRNELTAIAERLGLTPRCIWQDAVADVAPWLRAIDIFVLPSLSEALSNALIEAMAAGCCPVASRVGGNPELVENGRGMLFEPACTDELAKILNMLIADASLRCELAANARDFVVQNFSVATAARRMAAIYSDVLRNK